jgi:peptidoglycan/xylan/chitin deacetylase (PgdA/CDA1 family)
MRHYLKSVVKRALVMPGVREPFRWLVRDHAIIFMLHRFTDEANGIRGMDPYGLRVLLARIREQRLRVVSLEQLFDDLSAGRSVTGSVVFTIDDGYLHDLALVASLFAEFEFPITSFLTTAVVDGKLWFWWDQIEYLLEQTKKVRLEVTCGGRTLTCDLSTLDARTNAQRTLVSRCKDIAETDKLNLIEDLARATGVALPAKAPEKYRPVTWEEVHACETKGMRFGPHSITHPILSQVSDADSAAQIRGSWQRLQEEVSFPVRIFCYPNGREQDFGPREISSLRELGLKGSVTAVAGYASAKRFNENADFRYVVPRFEMPADETSLAQLTQGIERLKQLVRGQEK